MADPYHPVIGPYQAQKLLGAGGGGRVWLASGPRGTVALKTAQTEDQRTWLLREASVLSRVDHPYIVELVDADLQGRWLALEYVRGPSLLTWGKDRPLADAVDLGARLAEAVAHLHQSGILHGDLKPDNVMVDEQDSPRLLDLGTARRLADEAPTGFTGTLGFAAPELLRGEHGGPECDVYSLGAVLYHLVTGQPPFRDADPAALAYLPLSSLPEPPSSLRPGVPSALDELILQMLARRPGRRPIPTGSLPQRLRASLRSPAAEPVLGMSREREVLRRAIVGLDEGRPGLLVLHGRAGTGRGTLIREALAAAVREGIDVIEGRPPGDALRLVSGRDKPTVVSLESQGRETVSAVSRILVKRLPVLVLVRSERPLMSLTGVGARHLSPPRLTERQVATLLEHHGGDVRRAKEILQRTQGLPGAVRTYVAPTQPEAHALSPIQRELINATTAGPRPLNELATLLALTEHALVDLAEELLDLGLLVEVDDGASLAAARVDR